MLVREEGGVKFSHRRSEEELNFREPEADQYQEHWDQKLDHKSFVVAAILLKSLLDKRAKVVEEDVALAGLLLVGDRVVIDFKVFNLFLLVVLKRLLKLLVVVGVVSVTNSQEHLFQGGD